MNAPAKLGVYALLLAACLAGGYGVGAAVGPADDAPPTTATDPARPTTATDPARPATTADPSSPATSPHGHPMETSTP